MSFMSPDENQGGMLVDIDGGSASVLQSSGLFPSTVTRNGAGDYTVNLRSPMSELEMKPFVTPIGTTPLLPSVVCETDSRWRVRFSVAGTGTLTDPDMFFLGAKRCMFHTSLS